jgi:signal transduction histidine kinase
VRVQAITQFATIVVASMVGLALAGRVLRPLRALADTARTITETDLTQRIDVQGNDEASDIARAFNEMLERLEAAFATQRAFLDDVSHELHVPLSVVRGNVEVLDLVEDEAERVEMIAVATAEIERMNRMVEDMLLLARAERPGFLTLETVDLGDLVDDIHRRALALGDRDWRLEASGATGLAQLDPQRVTQAMMQLADNACQHTEPGDIIRIGGTPLERSGHLLGARQRPRDSSGGSRTRLSASCPRHFPEGGVGAGARPVNRVHNCRRARGTGAGSREHQRGTGRDRATAVFGGWARCPWLTARQSTDQ